MMGHEFLEIQSAIDANAGHDWCPFIPVFGAPAEMFERGEGTQLWSVSGKRYLDFLSGIAVVGLGHANPVIADAIADQARTLVHVSNFFANTTATKAAVAIADLMRDAGWAEALSGCTHVAHLASPLPSEVPESKEEVIAPARDGALRVLRFARDAGAKRFVLASSNGAIGYGRPRGD